MKPIIIVFLASIAALAQKSENDLSGRFDRLSCAIVQIRTADGSGTGFFTDGTGTVVTAAHVVVAVNYTGTLQNPMVGLTPKSSVVVRNSRGEEKAVQVSLERDDAIRAAGDLAIISSGLKPPCFLNIGDSSSARVGERLIAIGYPSLAPAAVLYEGFLASRHQHLPIPVGHIGTEPVIPRYEVFRIQMPITAGASGSPVIDSHDKVIGVVTEAPMAWTDDLTKLAQFAGQDSHGAGIFVGGFDQLKLLATLAWVVHEFESSGAGLAVPIYYLEIEHSNLQRKPNSPSN